MASPRTSPWTWSQTQTKTRTWTPPRLAALGLAIATALSVAGCGGGASNPAPAVNSAAKGTQAPAAATPPAQTLDPAAGPIQDPATLPKTCNGLVTDADIQLVAGAPLPGGDVYTAYQPLPNIKQTKRVKCQYGVVLDATGKVQSDEIEVVMASYSDAPSAKSRGAATVGGLAGNGGALKQLTVAGHPATLVTSATDADLVMYDGNRTYLVTIQAALATGDKADTLAATLAASLFKHTTAAGAAMPSSAASASGTPGAPGAPSAPSAGTSATPGAVASS